jgi:hypothetical protein
MDFLMKNPSDKQGKLTPEDVAWRRVYVENAIASQRLEGLDVGPETRADMERIALGEMDVDEAVRRLKQRVLAQRNGRFSSPK